MTFLTGFFTFISLSYLIQVHHWYDPWCCNDKDCRPVPCEELIEQKDGSYKYQNYTIDKSKVKPTQDNQCHVCIFNETGRCAYIQYGT